MEDVTTTTEYSFGCFRDPVVRLGDGDAKDDEREESAIKRNGLWTRTVGFEKSRSGPLRMNGAMPPRANELFARKNMDFLLILEKKNHHHHHHQQRKRKKKKRKPRLRKLIRGTVKKPAPAGSNKNPVAGNEGLLEMK